MRRKLIVRTNDLEDLLSKQSSDSDKAVIRAAMGSSIYGFKKTHPFMASKRMQPFMDPQRTPASMGGEVTPWLISGDCQPGQRLNSLSATGEYASRSFRR
jgi:hypothetical protein